MDGPARCFRRRHYGGRGVQRRPDTGGQGRPPRADPRASVTRRSKLFARADTLRAANSRLIRAQSGLGLAQRWGAGLLASVDGMRFVVPVATVNAGANPRYFGQSRGLTWLNYLNDQVAGLGAVVVPAYDWP